MDNLGLIFLSEVVGTALLTLLGCGVVANVVLGKNKGFGGGFLMINFGWGLAVFAGVTAAYYSGAHLNPAVTLGLVAARRFPPKEAPSYIAAQCVGAVVGAGLLYVIASGKAGFAVDASKAGAFATNGFGDFSPGHYGLVSALVAEIVLTMFFLLVILGSTHGNAPRHFAPIAIGLGLTLIHLIGIPVTNLSVNPARSLGPAVFVGGAALSQLWLFWVAPIVGGVLGGLLYPALIAKNNEPEVRGDD